MGYYRSSHHRCSVNKGVLRNFAKLTGKYLFQVLFFSKVAGLMSATLLKKRLWHRCFPVNFAKFLRTSFSQNTSGRLLLILLTDIWYCTTHKEKLYKYYEIASSEDSCDKITTTKLRLELWSNCHSNSF